MRYFCLRGSIVLHTCCGEHNSNNNNDNNNVVIFDDPKKKKRVEGSGRKDVVKRVSYLRLDPPTSHVRCIYNARAVWNPVACIHAVFSDRFQMGQLNGGSGQLSQLHIGAGGGGHQAASPSLLSGASQTYQIGSAAPNTPAMITHHQLSPVSANITLMGQSNGELTVLMYRSQCASFVRFKNSFA